MVAWKTFRPGGTGGVAVYDYGSNQRRLLERVGDGGTLWLVTSTRRKRQPRRYHLAYKLVDCTAIEPRASLFSGRYDYVVRARDWQASRHFGFNDATSTLRRLRFTSGKPMAEVGNAGLRLLSIPELASGDVTLLERLQHRIEQGRQDVRSGGAGRSRPGRPSTGAPRPGEQVLASEAESHGPFGEIVRGGGKAGYGDGPDVALGL
jgi:hypothetical protein